MKTIYAIRDKLANELVGMNMYMLFIFRTDQQAVRYFADAINDKTSVLHKHAGDYELVALGILAQTANSHEVIKGTEVPVVIITGDALLAAQTPELVREA